MKITIADRLKPFCHVPGTSCVIPWSSWKVQAFPTLLKFENLMGFEKQEHLLEWKGPVLDFTVELDLEKGVVWVYGHTIEGYRRVCVYVAHHKIVVGEKPAMQSSTLERLSLGMHKSLDWQLVHRRHNMAEIFPVWFRLGQMVPEQGKTAVLREVEKTEVSSTYLKIFLAGFEGIMSPRFSDTDYQGIISGNLAQESPLILLTAGARYIRGLFFKEIGETWSFLPCLAPEFHAGRFLQLQTEAGDKIDFEWSKKLLKKVVIHPAKSREISLSFPKPLKSFRVGKKVRHVIDKPLQLITGEILILDRFEK
jgi:hypothetical protein